MPDDAALDTLATEPTGSAVRDLRARIAQPNLGDDLADLRLQLGKALMAQARFGEAARELEALAADSGLAPARRAAAFGVLAGALMLTDRTADGEAVAKRALASRAASAETRVMARSAIRGLRFFEGRFDEAVRLARANVRDAADAGPLARGEARLDMGGMLFHADRFEEAEPWFVLDADATASQRQDAVTIRATMNLVRGRWQDVLDAVPVAGGGADADWSDLSHAFLPALRAHALIHLDRAEQARRELGRPIGRGAPPVAFVDWALLAELDGDLTAVGALVERAVALHAERGFRPQLRVWGLDLVRLALAAGDPSTARRMADLLEELTPMSRVASVRAAALAARGMVERDSALLDEAHGLFAKGPRLVATAQTAEELGQVHRERGNRPAAVSALRRALAVWFSIGAMSDVRRTARRLTELGVRTRAGTRRRGGTGWESLTPTEATVAVLVGEGMTNAEIATRLVVSRRTVETHVAHVFAKLDVRTRAGVARIAAQRRT